MAWKLIRTCPDAGRQTTAAGVVAAGIFLGAGAPAFASSFQLTALVTDDNANLTSLGFPAATTEDPNLVNPWGISFAATSPFWISDNGAGVATLYSGAGVPQPQPNPLVVTIAAPNPPPPGFTVAAPTGQVHNPGTAGFDVTAGGKTGSSVFMFATEDGTISGWSPGVDPTHSVVAIDHSQNGNGAVYKGLAVAQTGGGQTLLYAANFRASAGAGAVEVYDQNFHLVNTITDSSLPTGYAPFNVQVLNGKLYVTFALQDPSKNNHDDLAGLGNGFVDVFNLDGSGMQRLVSNGVLDSPWGLAIAPAGFGSFAGKLLVGNFGNGQVNVFDPTSGKFLGTLDAANGNPIDIPGLWDLTAGNNGTGVNPNAIYFTAGLPAADVPDLLEQDGLFGDLTLIPEPTSLAALVVGLAGVIWLRRRRILRPSAS